MNEDELPDFLDAKGRAVFRTARARIPDFAQEFEPGLILIAHLTQRHEDDEMLVPWLREFFLTRDSSRDHH